MSNDAVAISLPEGQNATHVTNPSCPVSVRTNVPVVASHILAVLSWLADANVPPEGENTTPLMRPSCPFTVIS